MLRVSPRLSASVVASQAVKLARLVTLFGAAFAVAGCGAPQHQRHHHLASPPDEESVEEPLAKVVPWPGFGALSSMPSVGEARVSLHRLGDETATTKVNAAAAGYASGSDLGPGAVVLEALSAGHDAPVTSYFVMQKRESGYFPAGGDWEYLVVNPSGGVEASGQLVRCARCHAEAPRQFVFGPASLIRSTEGGG